MTTPSAPGHRRHWLRFVKAKGWRSTAACDCGWEAKAWLLTRAAQQVIAHANEENAR